MRRERKWELAAKKADFKAIADQFGIDQVTARLIRNRDVIGWDKIQEYLNGTLESLHDPHQMKGCEKAAGLLKEKITEREKIRIIGDYDADGVNATYILFRAIQKCGGLVDYEIPDRMKDGYGLNRSLVELAYQEGVDTIVTCDNGISAVEEIALAKDEGLTVILTDHHEPGKILPPADVIVNPHQEGCQYPFKELCGAGVAFNVVRLLYEKMGFSSKEAQEFVIYVGFATIEDIVDLKGENRILAREALERLRRGENLGYRELCRANEIDPANLNSHQVGFILGPCINASGRLDTAKRSLRLLLTEDEKEARKIAQELKELNDQRRELTQKAENEAAALIEGDPTFLEDRVLVLYLPNCHESIAGIVAGRIRDQYYKPTFVVTDSEKEGIAKGSSRSIEPYPMFEEMQKCSDLFIQFGGHPMAAGFTIDKDRIHEMRQRLNENCSLTEEDLTEELLIDVAMPFYYISEKVVKELSYLEPTGKGNTKPIFCERNVRLLSARTVGSKEDTLQLEVMGARDCRMKAVLFHGAEDFRLYLTRKFGDREVNNLFMGLQNEITLDLAYYPSVNTYRGNSSLQIQIQFYR